MGHRYQQQCSNIRGSFNFLWCQFFHLQAHIILHQKSAWPITNIQCGSTLITDEALFKSRCIISNVAWSTCDGSSNPPLPTPGSEILNLLKCGPLVSYLMQLTIHEGDSWRTLTTFEGWDLLRGERWEQHFRYQSSMKFLIFKFFQTVIPVHAHTEMSVLRPNEL